MLFKCFAVMGTEIDAREPISYCVIGCGRLTIGLTLEECIKKVLKKYPDAEFKQNCGWVFIGEEEELLNPEIQELVEASNAVSKTSKVSGDPDPEGKL